MASTVKGELVFLWAEKGRHQRFESCLSGMDCFLFINCQEHWSSFRYCGKGTLAFPRSKYLSRRPIGQRWQTAGGGSNPWSTRESQVRPAERQRAPTTKKWSKYLSKGRLICFVHAGRSNVLGWSVCRVWFEEGKHNISGFASHSFHSGIGRKLTIVSKNIHAEFQVVCHDICQTRQNFLILVSMVELVDTTVWDPENCLVSVLRYLMSAWMLHCVFHQKSFFCPMSKVWGVHRCWVRVLDVFLFQYLFHFNSVFSRHQSAVTLSSCETDFFWPAPVAFRRVTTWGLPVDQRGIEPPPAVCPRSPPVRLSLLHYSQVFRKESACSGHWVLCPIYPRVCHKTVASMLTIRQSRLLLCHWRTVYNPFDRQIIVSCTLQDGPGSQNSTV